MPIIEDTMRGRSRQLAILGLSRIGASIAVLKNNSAVMVWTGVLILGCALALVTLFSDGNEVAVVAALLLVAIVTVTLNKVEWGFYLFVFMVLVSDQYGVPGFQDALTKQLMYLQNINNIKYLPNIQEGVVTPMELHLFFLVMTWIFVVARRNDISHFKIPHKFAVFAFLLALCGAIAYGAARGGDPTVSLWETRALFYLVIMILLVPQIIVTREHVQALLWFCIAGISFKALQGTVRYAANGFSFGNWPAIIDTFTNHEDPVFFITLFLLLLGFAVFGVDHKQRKVLLALFPLLLMGFVAAQRRATYASFSAALFAFIAILPKKERLQTLRPLVIVLVILAIYVAAFWDSSSKMGVVAQQFKATFTNESGVRGDKDNTSRFYRELENYNLAMTFQDAPVVGIGFGRPYEKRIRLWGSDFPLGDYIPHNQIVWIFVKMGTIGAFFFWIFFNSSVMNGAVVYAKLKDPYFKALCAVCVVAVINQVVVSYVDMQLAWYRNMVYLGTLLGLIPVLERLDRAAEGNT